MEPINLAKALRALRRAADLSQRELAGQAGLPKSTIGRIEAGEISNPTFRTVERLVNAAGGHMTVSVAPDPLQDSGITELLALAKSRAPDDIPHEDLTDTAGRHYPAHLDVRATYPPFVHGSPVRAGTRVDTYELNRFGRDLTRENRAPGMALEVEHRELTPDYAWEWTACTAVGRQVGWLGAQLWPDLDAPRRGPDTRQGLLSAGWSSHGAGKRLVQTNGSWLSCGRGGPSTARWTSTRSTLNRVRAVSAISDSSPPEPHRGCSS